MYRDIIIVGAGAAGLFCSLVIDDLGGKPLLLERNDRIGKKLLATGNGRCNYTNSNISINNYHSMNPLFPKSALNSFDNIATMNYFEKLGITPASEGSSKIFPQSFQASSFLDLFLMELDRRDIEVKTDTFITNIEKNKDGFTLSTKEKDVFKCKKLILATGGMSMPKSGSDGNGYRLCKLLNHSVTDVFPALVQLDLDYPLLKSVDGVKVDAKLSLFINDKKIKSDEGDVLFTKYGISGPPILQLSRLAIEGLRENNDVAISLALVQKDLDEIYDYLSTRFKSMANRKISEALIGFVHKKLILPLLKNCNIDKDRLASALSEKELLSLSSVFRDWRFKVIGNQSFGSAQATAGGINTAEINPSTLESKLIKDLFLIGELLDVDGDCGGFNLQWAWSSAWLAANNVMK